MSAPVDVLAVMDARQAILVTALLDAADIAEGEEVPRDVLDRIEVSAAVHDDLRSAVAQLIDIAAEAAKQLRALKVEAHASALQSALARCKGGAA